MEKIKQVVKMKLNSKQGFFIGLSMFLIGTIFVTIGFQAGMMLQGFSSAIMLVSLHPQNTIDKQVQTQ